MLLGCKSIDMIHEMNVFGPRSEAAAALDILLPHGCTTICFKVILLIAKLTAAKETCIESNTTCMHNTGLAPRHARLLLLTTEQRAHKLGLGASTSAWTCA